MSGMLLVGSMPIGNIDDITIRMINAFRDCDVIFSDDSPSAAIEILRKYKIEKDIVVLKSTDSLYCDPDQIKLMVDYIDNGKTVLLVATEGQVGIADPGFQFIQEAIKRKIKYTVLPGPSAFMNAYVHSGHILGRFIIRETIHYDIEGILGSYADQELPVVFHVWSKDVEEMAQVLNKLFQGKSKMITLACNMTMPSEFVIRDRAENLINNEELNRFKKYTHVTAVLSNVLDEEDMFI